MKLILKLLAVPFALALTIMAALFSFVLAMSDKVFGLLAGLTFLVSIGLFITGQPTGGIAFLVVTFLVSPFGLPALVGCIGKGLDGISGALRAFLVS